MENITEQRFVDRLIQALASLPQNDPRAYGMGDAGSAPVQPPISKSLKN